MPISDTTWPRVVVRPVVSVRDPRDRISRPTAPEKVN